MLSDVNNPLVIILFPPHSYMTCLTEESFGHWCHLWRVPSAQSNKARPCRLQNNFIKERRYEQCPKMHRSFKISQKAN